MARSIIQLSVLVLLTLVGWQTNSIAQCAGGAYWVNGPNTGGSLRDTGVVLLTDTVLVRTTNPTSGSFASGRPLYEINTSVWDGRNYQGLKIARGGGRGASTSFKLLIPVDSFQIHMKVSDVRGDIFNAENQSIRGFLNGVQVNSTFKELIANATRSGDNLIGGGSTTPTNQSAARIFFHGPIDSISVTSIASSDYVIIELMARCDIVLFNRMPNRPPAVNTITDKTIQIRGNPFRHQLQIAHQTSLNQIRLIDQQGRICFQWTEATKPVGIFYLPTDRLAMGMYQLHIIDQMGRSFVRLVKKE
jgi:hypothetical protein